MDEPLYSLQRESKLLQDVFLRNMESWEGFFSPAPTEVLHVGGISTL